MNATPQRQYLFFDLRHIACGDLDWRSSDGTYIPLNNPPLPQVAAVADAARVPFGIRLAAQPPTREAPIGVRLPSMRVMYDGGVYRCWGIKCEHPPKQDFGSYTQTLPLSVAIVYMESADGYDWREVTRSPLQAPGQYGLDGFGFFVDPLGTPEERYKGVYMAHPPKEEVPALWERFYAHLHPRYRDVRLSPQRFTCMYAVTSPDGLHWQAVKEPLMAHYSDTDTTVTYNAWLGRYVMYTRLYLQDRRWVGIAEAEDFYQWGPVQRLLWPQLDWPYSYDIYTNGYCTYPGLPQYHLMFPMVYHRFDQTSDIRLYTSEDGLCWNEAPGSPIITPGPPGTWDSEYLAGGKDLTPHGPGRVGMLYYGTVYPHKYPRWEGVLESMQQAWAWWPEGRLCALTADEEGQFCTVPLVPAGRELRLNMRTTRAGEIRVEVMDVQGRSLADCAPLVGDHASIPVSWNGSADIGTPDGEPIVLRFSMRAAELFGFAWV